MRRQNRLRNRRDFRRVFRHGKSTANRNFVLYMLPNHRNSTIRIGVSISKKVAKHAVQRNRVKRLVKEAVRQRIGQLPPHWDLVIIARRPSTELNFRQTEQSLLHLFHKARLLSRKK